MTFVADKLRVRLVCVFLQLVERFFFAAHEVWYHIQRHAPDLYPNSSPLIAGKISPCAV
jgi:hypothetical protein